MLNNKISTIILMNDLYKQLIFMVLGIIMAKLFFNFVLPENILVIETNLEKSANCINKNL